jgi:hypothetical protein
MRREYHCGLHTSGAVRRSIRLNTHTHVKMKTIRENDNKINVERSFTKCDKCDRRCHSPIRLKKHKVDYLQYAIADM